MLKKIAIGFGIALVSVYILFLIVPLFISGIVNSYSDDISKIIEENTGFKVKLEKLRLITTPKLTVGLKIGHIEAALPTDDNFLIADNAQAKLSLLPILYKKIELDFVGAENINVTLKVKKDGKFLLEDYIPETQEDETSKEINQSQNSLPFGIKLSNCLPDISINNYNITFVDIPTLKQYSIYGNKFLIHDFILNKKVKIYADGKFKLVDREQFSFNIKLFNKIMPDIDINDIVFAEQEETVKPKSQNDAINIVDIFNALYNNQLTATLDTDIITSGTVKDINLTGKINVSNISLAVDGKPLPEGNVDLLLKNNKINLNSKLYSSPSEITEFIGNFVTGKHPVIDITCKSNAQFNSIIKLVNSIAKSFGINDLNTLSATGGLDADFNVNSNLKELKSSGYIKIPSASISYKLYNIIINDIFADINLENNLININNSGFKILGQPLLLKGTVSSDANADLNLTANRLSIKGLLLALGQFALLKENNINSGTISLDAALKGKLESIVPKILVSIDNVNVKNIPSDTTVTVSNSKVNLITDGQKFSGGIDINNLKILNPIANIIAPLAKIAIGERDINIENSYILLDNSRIDISGIVSDYLSKNISFNINANGNLLASDVRSMVPQDFRSEVQAKGQLPLVVKITGNDKSQDIQFSLTSNPNNYVALINVNELRGKNSIIKGNIKINGETLKFLDTGVYANGNGLAYLSGSISDLYNTQKLNLNISTSNNISMVIPYFPKSNMDIGMNINVVGTALNPILKGDVSIPGLTMPEMDLKMNELRVSLNGPIAKGKGTLKEFVTGGIQAQNLSSDFELTNDVFYLKNMLGDAFSGKIKGDISYNIVNGKVGVDIKGTGMNAENAIAGAAGIKNALSGTLEFSANVTTSGANDVEMMKNLKGKASFDIKDGELGNIGRFENFILAKNIMSNSILKTAAESVTNLTTVKNTAKFKLIDGILTFSDGWATLNPVTMSGSTMSYYITGKYNLLNGTANVVILGRLAGEVVKLLGTIGDLSVTKLTSNIPVLGTATTVLLKSMTSNPDNEKISNIPALSSGTTLYKDFKVEFNGGVESSSSVKSFKWLTTCDTSGIEVITVKDAVQNAKKAIDEAKQQKIDTVNKAIEEQKQQINNAKKQIEETKQQVDDAKKQLKDSANDLKDAANELKNMFKF